MVREYKWLVQLRTTHSALRTGSLESYNDNNIVAFKRHSGVDEVMVFANVRNAAETFHVPVYIQNTTWTNVYSGAPVTLDSVVNLASYEYVVLLK